MYETNWVADQNRIMKEENFLAECFDQAFSLLQSNTNDLTNYPVYKEKVLEIAEEKLNKAFQLFHRCMIQGNNLAWTIAHKTLYARSYGWIRKKGITDDEQLTILFNESIERFYEKYTGSNLVFEHSTNLKSYFFRILELRILEHNRTAKRQQSFTLDSNEVRRIPFDRDVILDIVEEEENERIRRAIDQLSETERTILIGYYYEKSNLKEIADCLGKSEENIRVLKHRSLKKLSAILK